MKYSFKQIVSSLPKKKNSKSSIWVKLIVRKLSFPFTYLLINIGFSAWAASVFSIFVALAGCLLLALNSQPLMIIGVLLIELWLIFDCVDGNIARVSKTTSLMGEFIDALSGYIISGFVYLAIGIAAYHTTFLLKNYAVYFIIIGSMASIANILTRLIHQKYVYSLLMINGGKENQIEEEVEERKGISYIRSRVDKELGLSGLFMPFLIIALFFNLFDIMVIFYLLFSFAALGVMSTVYALKSKNIKENKKKYKIGYTTGVFDMFHIGHLNILKNAKDQCDYLIVGVTTDELCRKRKNKTPVIPFEERVKILLSNKYVNRVVEQKNMDKVETQKELNYDVVFVGSDWEGTPSWKEYEEEYSKIGVKVVYLPHTDGISSTILQKKLHDNKS